MTFKYMHPKAGESYLLDQERNITIFNKPPSPEIPYRLEILMEEKKIVLEVEVREKLNDLNKKFDMFWSVKRVYWQKPDDKIYMHHSVPLDKREEVVKLISEGLDVYGAYGRQEKTNSVSINFEQSHWD